MNNTKDKIEWWNNLSFQDKSMYIIIHRIILNQDKINYPNKIDNDDIILLYDLEH